MDTPKDILLDSDSDVLIKDGDFVVDESEMQEVGIIIRASQGDVKPEPLIGANLIKFIRTGATRQDIKRAITFQLELDAKDYDEIKDRIKYE